MIRSIGRSALLFVIVATLALVAQPAIAAITKTTASVSTTVQELIDGAPGSVNSDFLALPDDQAMPPLQATSLLESTDFDGQLIGRGQAYGDYLDPARVDQPNPEEFAVETACYSNGGPVSYVIQGAATETRSIVFTSPGSVVADPEIEFNADRTATVESRVFFTAALVFWSGDSNRDLTGMSAELSITVTRDGTDSPLFETSFSADGDVGGAVKVDSAGPIRFEAFTLGDLEQAGLDADSLAVLRQIDQFGTLRIVGIPPQEHAYQYDVTADESFDLSAELTANVRNVPEGTGAAVVLGRPFSNLTDVIAEALPGVNGQALTRAINKVNADRALGLVDGGSTDSPRGGLCGAIGAAPAIGLIGALSLTRVRRRRSLRGV